MRIISYAERKAPIAEVVSRYVNRIDERLRPVEVHLAQTEAAAVEAEPGHARAWIAEDPAGVCVGVLFASERSWETGHFGCRFEQLHLFRGSPAGEPEVSTSEALVAAWLKETRPFGGYATIRVNARDVDVLRGVEAHGFRTLAPMVTLTRLSPGPGETPDPQPDGLTIGACQLEDVEQVVGIARDAFIYGRFWTEPGLDREVARTMHGEWAENCCRKKQADEVFVAKRDGEVRGFNAVRVRAYSGFAFGEINLIAVQRGTRGAGVGRALVDAGNHWLGARAPLLVVRTELPNAAAIRLYERRGFVTVEGCIYLGMYVG